MADPETIGLAIKRRDTLSEVGLENQRLGHRRNPVALILSSS
jgi:hypothetical protein